MQSWPAFGVPLVESVFMDCCGARLSEYFQNRGVYSIQGRTPEGRLRMERHVVGGDSQKDDVEQKVYGVAPKDWARAIQAVGLDPKALYQGFQDADRYAAGLEDWAKKPVLDLVSLAHKPNDPDVKKAMKELVGDMSPDDRVHRALLPAVSLGDSVKDGVEHGIKTVQSVSEAVVKHFSKPVNPVQDAAILAKAYIEDLRKGYDDLISPDPYKRAQAQAGIVAHVANPGKKLEVVADSLKKLEQLEDAISDTAAVAKKAGKLEQAIDKTTRAVDVVKSGATDIEKIEKSEESLGKRGKRAGSTADEATQRPPSKPYSLPGLAIIH